MGLSGTRRRAWTPPKAVRYQSGPWVGMRDTVTSGSAPPNLALGIRNMVPERAAAGAGLLTRPGFGCLPGLATMYTHCRGIHQFDRRDGSRYSVWFFDQSMVVVTDSAETVVPLSGGAAIAPADVADPDAPFLVHAVTFNDRMVVSDGVNTPWMWDGSSFTVLTNAPVAHGRPAVHDDRVFLVKDSERGTIVWCEVGDAETGYEAGGFNNAWTLQTTGSGALGAILGTNDGLYYWRTTGGFDAVRGDVDSEYRTSSTVDGLDTHVGCASPAGVLLDGNGIWFIDQFGHPQFHAIGTRGVQQPEIWEDGAKAWMGTKLSSVYTTASVDTSRLSHAQVVRHPSLDCILFNLPVMVGHATPVVTNGIYRMLACYSASTGQLQSMWTNLPLSDGEDENYFDAHAIGVAYNTGAYRFAHGTSRAWLHQNPREISSGLAPIPYYVDYYDGTTSLPIRSWMETNTLGADDAVPMKYFDRVDLLVNEAHLPDVGLSYRTPTSYALSERIFATSGVVKDDGRIAYGISGYGRVLRVRIYAAPGGGGSVEFDGDGDPVFDVTINPAYGTPLAITQLVMQGRLVSMDPFDR